MSFERAFLYLFMPKDCNAKNEKGALGAFFITSTTKAA
jgi:hypothetical protein